jgi:flagellar biosynthesis anti-sigma factor FlgM
MMKIDGSQTNDGSSRVRFAPVGQERTSANLRQERTGGDRIALSPDAHLLGTALQAAAQAPDVRQDVVERTRRKLEAGTVGSDLTALADRIISQLLGP